MGASHMHLVSQAKEKTVVTMVFGVVGWVVGGWGIGNGHHTTARLLFQILYGPLEAGDSS